MNENRIKTSTNTGEVSLPSAKESGLDLKSSNIGQMSPHGYLVRLGNGLPTGQRWKECGENSDKNHFDTLNLKSNGKSRFITAKSIPFSNTDYESSNLSNSPFPRRILLFPRFCPSKNNAVG
jgi:hypothetical protein